MLSFLFWCVRFVAVWVGINGQGDILVLSRKLGIPTPAEGEDTDAFFYGKEKVRRPTTCILNTTLCDY